MHGSCSSTVFHNSYLLYWNSISQLYRQIKLVLDVCLCSSFCRTAAPRPGVSPGLVTLQAAMWDIKDPFSVHVCRSRNLVKCLPFERDTIRNMQIFAYFWLYLFWIVHFFDSSRMCKRVSLHGLLRSEIEFRHHLPVVLRIHNLLIRTCIWRTTGRCCQNFVSDTSRSWRLTSYTLPRVGLGPIFTYYIV